jgi:hypothetical protein
MKSSPSTFISLFLLLFATILSAQNNNSPKLTGPYLGQKPPGLKPEIFAPGIVSTENRVYANVTFNPDLNEVCWTPNSGDTTLFHGGLLISKKSDKGWSGYEEVRFLKKGYSHRSPYYGLNGNRLYFQGYKNSNQGWDQMERFYYVEKTKQGWSEPKLLDSIFNKYAIHWQFSVDKENNLYFAGNLRGEDSTGGIYFSKYVNGKYHEPDLIFSDKEYGEFVFGPTISPDNSYLLFTRVHPRGSTNPRIFSIYISFRNENEKWNKPLELGEKLNMDGNQPRISPDGKFIFFVGNDGQSYWVDAKIIDALKQQTLND